MDTLKSLAVISLLGAVLYGVYVVASKPDKPLSPEMEALASGADAPLIEGGTPDISVPRIEGPGVASPSGEDRDSFPSPPRTREEASPAPPPQGPLPSRDAVPEDAGGADVTGRSQTPQPEVAGDYPAEPLAPLANGVRVVSGTSPSIDDAEIAAAQQRIQLYAFQMAWKTAREQVSQNRHREALLALTPFYGESAIPAEQHQELVGWLDALAAKVIYSTEHLLEPAHVVRRPETLYDIAEQYRVPYLLLKNINSVRDNDVLVPGSKLKVLTGPFRAEVSLSKLEITVFVQKLYAGRFKFTLGNESAPAGEYLVKEKDPAKQFSGPQGPLDAKDPRNPYGGIYIGLGNGVAMHGSPGEAYADQQFGCIQLAPRDAEDLMAILSKDESTVIIRE